jgi:hypothetical protein
MYPRVEVQHNGARVEYMGGLRTSEIVSTITSILHPTHRMNSLADVNRLFDVYDVAVLGCDHDTCLCHQNHCLNLLSIHVRCLVYNICHSIELLAVASNTNERTHVDTHTHTHTHTHTQSCTRALTHLPHPDPHTLIQTTLGGCRYFPEVQSGGLSAQRLASFHSVAIATLIQGSNPDLCFGIVTDPSLADSLKLQQLDVVFRLPNMETVHAPANVTRSTS